MSSKFGVNSKPAANSDAYRNSAFWDKKEAEPITLDFKVEELSGQHYALSEKSNSCTYWIDDDFNLYFITPTYKGPITDHCGEYNTLEGAKKAAQEKEEAL